MRRPVPAHPSMPTRHGWLGALAVAALLAGLALVGLGATALLGRGGGASQRATVPVAQLPAPAAPRAAATVPSAGAKPAPPVADAPAPKRRTETRAEERFAANDRAHVRAAWVAGFYPIYAAAQRTFGVNWLLIAAIHKQETAFSTSRGIYAGVNFAHCCAGPMQFNVTNGPASTWDRYAHAYRAAARPSAYNHPTASHPSVYDDFDAIMGAAALLRDEGAGPRLDAGAWRAAYDYYGHDLTGVDYADQVLTRALSWGRGGFCINCELDPGTLAAVDSAWGAPVRASLAPPEKPRHRGPKSRAPDARAASTGP